MTTATERREQLKAVYQQARVCTDCQLHMTRTTVVFGAGNANADLMFVGEAPGRSEDEQGVPFVGRAGKLLDQLLGEIGLERHDVFICNTLKCRPPGNRDPYPDELETCAHYLHSQVQLIEPKVICTLGNFATKLLRGDNTGISRLHGQAEITTIGPRAVHLYPLYHPAAALYTPSMIETLRADFAGIAPLLAADPPPQPDAQPPRRSAPSPELRDLSELEALDALRPEHEAEVELEVPEAEPEPELAPPEAVTKPSAPSTEAEPPASPEQLGLF